MLELSLFCSMHTVAFLAAFLAVGAIQTVSQSGVISLACILFAIVTPCLFFIYTKGKNISETG